MFETVLQSNQLNGSCLLYVILPLGTYLLVGVKTILIYLMSSLTDVDADGFVEVSGIWWLTVKFTVCLQVCQEIPVIWSISLEIIFILAKFFQNI